MNIEPYVSHKTVYRTAGRDSTLGHIGCGFMRKEALREDVVDYVRDEYSLVYVLRGSGTYIEKDGRRHELSPGTIFHRIPGNHHTTILDPAGKWVECFIAVGSGMFAVLETLGIIDVRRPVVHLGLSAELVTGFNNLYIMLQQVPDRELGRCLTALLSIFNDLQHSSPVRSDHDRLIDVACARLEEDIQDRIPLEAIARDLAIGYERFRKLFKSATGLSPHAYRIRRRMERARTLLEQKKTIKSVAAMLGYSNAYAFAAQFQREVGISPGRFIKR